MMDGGLQSVSIRKTVLIIIERERKQNNKRDDCYGYLRDFQMIWSKGRYTMFSVI